MTSRAWPPSSPDTTAAGSTARSSAPMAAWSDASQGDINHAFCKHQDPAGRAVTNPEGRDRAPPHRIVRRLFRRSGAAAYDGADRGSRGRRLWPRRRGVRGSRRVSRDARILNRAIADRTRRAIAHAMTPKSFETRCLRLPAVTKVVQWGDTSVFKVGGKMFALGGGFSARSGGYMFKVSNMAYAMLIEHGLARPAPYLARAKWVQLVGNNALPDAELTAYLAQAHAMVATKLTRKSRKALGLD